MKRPPTFTAELTLWKWPSPQGNSQTQHNPYKNLHVTLYRNQRNHPKIHMETHKALPRKPQINPTQKKNAGEMSVPDFKLYHRAFAAIKEMPTKTALRWHLPLGRTAMMNKTTENTCWRGRGEREASFWVGQISEKVLKAFLKTETTNFDLELFLTKL